MIADLAANSSYNVRLTEEQADLVANSSYKQLLTSSFLDLTAAGTTLVLTAH